jgi:hypothetical protein
MTASPKRSQGAIPVNEKPEPDGEVPAETEGETEAPELLADPDPMLLLLEVEFVIVNVVGELNELE